MILISVSAQMFKTVKAYKKQIQANFSNRDACAKATDKFQEKYGLKDSFGSTSKVQAHMQLTGYASIGGIGNVAIVFADPTMVLPVVTFTGICLTATGGFFTKHHCGAHFNLAGQKIQGLSTTRGVIQNMDAALSDQFNKYQDACYASINEPSQLKTAKEHLDHMHQIQQDMQELAQYVTIHDTHKNEGQVSSYKIVLKAKKFRENNTMQMPRNVELSDIDAHYEKLQTQAKTQKLKR